MTDGLKTKLPQIIYTYAYIYIYIIIFVLMIKYTYIYICCNICGRQKQLNIIEQKQRKGAPFGGVGGGEPKNIKNSVSLG